MNRNRVIAPEYAQSAFRSIVREWHFVQSTSDCAFSRQCGQELALAFDRHAGVWIVEHFHFRTGLSVLVSILSPERQRLLAVA